MILQLHSYWAYITLIALLVAFFSSLFNLWKKNNFQSRDLRIALFALIAVHIQLLIGIAWYFMSPSYNFLKENGMGEAMKDSLVRLHTIEHPLVMILATILVTIGFSQLKKKKNNKAVFKTLIIYYGIALLLVFSRLPWQQWFD